jgi:hypothetical protein
MMRWLLLGALLGLLLVTYPPLLTLAVAALAAVASQPAVAAFTLGLIVRPYLARSRRWTA